MLPLRIALIFLLIALSTVLHVVPLLLVAVIKALLPFHALRQTSNPLLTGIAESWIGVNSWMLARLTDTRVVVQGDGALLGQTGAANLAQHLQAQHMVLAQARRPVREFTPQAREHRAPGIELYVVALTVVKTQGFDALVARQGVGQAGGRILPAREKNQGAGMHRGHS